MNRQLREWLAGPWGAHEPGERRQLERQRQREGDAERLQRGVALGIDRPERDQQPHAGLDAENERQVRSGQSRNEESDPMGRSLSVFYEDGCGLISARMAVW